jgi:tight adherence protein B
MSALVALLSGVAVAVGLWLAIVTATGRVAVALPARAADRRSPVASAPPLQLRDAAFAVAAVAAAVAVLAGTRLVVAALAAAMGVLLVPRVLRARAERERAVAKMRAASEFVEAIRGALGAGSGLEAAIIDSARRPPQGLAVELTEFVEDSRLPEVTTEQALRRLAERAGEPAIDLLVGSLLAALRGAAGDMGRLFERIADQGRDFAETRAQTQAERARVEFQTRVLSLLVIGVALLSVLVSPDLIAVYGPSVGGQALLAIPVVVFALGWWWLITMNRVQAQHRFRLRVPAPAGGGSGR